MFPDLYLSIPMMRANTLKDICAVVSVGGV